jgi:hypothetical protein
MNRSWQAPQSDVLARDPVSSSYKLGWLDEICKDGQYWNESKPGFRDWERSRDILNGIEPKRSAGLDGFRTYASGRRLRTNTRTAIEGLANIRPMWGFHSKEFEQIATMYNKTSRALFLEGNWGEDIKDWIWWSAATNAGFMRPVFRRSMAGMGKGKIQLFTYGMPCVLPFQIPANGNYQEAYAVTLMDEIPIFEAHSRWPLYQDQLKPTKSLLWYSSDIRGAAEQNAPKRRMRNWWARGDTDENRGSDLYIPIRFTTIIDSSINTTGKTVPMGQPGTPWYYEVPAYGDRLPLGFENPATGQEAYREATEDDCRLYPFRRMIISSEHCVMYDNTAFNWHGEVDLIHLSLDRTPWNPTGFSLVHDGFNIEKNVDALERGALDRAKAQNKLSLAYDINGVTDNEAKSFDPLDTDNNRVGYDGSEVDQPYKLPLPLEWYHIRPEMFEMIKHLQDEMDYTMQLRDLVELSKAKALGKDMASLEKTLSALGPIVKGMGLSMERALAKVGNQVGWLIPQYMTAAEVMSYVGPESMAMEIFDYNPQDLYQSHMPDELATQESKSKYTSAQRARFARGKIKFQILPHSAHEIRQMEMLLLMLQMKARGMEISDYTCMSAAGIPDVEAPEGNSEQQRFRSEQETKLAFEVRKAVIAQTWGLEQHIMPQGQPGKPNGKGTSGGRPPTAQAAPHMEQKGGGTRTTISESH